jgi:hypothetical protein
VYTLRNTTIVSTGRRYRDLGFARLKYLWECHFSQTCRQRNRNLWECTFSQKSAAQGRAAGSRAVHNVADDPRKRASEDADETGSSYAAAAGPSDRSIRKKAGPHRQGPNPPHSRCPRHCPLKIGRQARPRTTPTPGRPRRPSRPGRARRPCVVIKLPQQQVPHPAVESAGRVRAYGGRLEFRCSGWHPCGTSGRPPRRPGRRAFGRERSRYGPGQSRSRTPP